MRAKWSKVLHVTCTWWDLPNYSDRWHLLETKAFEKFLRQLHDCRSANIWVLHHLLPHSVLLSTSWLRNPLSSIRAAPILLSLTVPPALLLPPALSYYLMLPKNVSLPPNPTHAPVNLFSSFGSILFLPGSESFLLLKLLPSPSCHQIIQLIFHVAKLGPASSRWPTFRNWKSCARFALVWSEIIRQ